MLSSKQVDEIEARRARWGSRLEFEDGDALVESLKEAMELLREAWVCLDPKGTYESTEARVTDALANWERKEDHVKS